MQGKDLSRRLSISVYRIALLGDSAGVARVASTLDLIEELESDRHYLPESGDAYSQDLATEETLRGLTDRGYTHLILAPDRYSREEVGRLLYRLHQLELPIWLASEDFAPSAIGACYRSWHGLCYLDVGHVRRTLPYRTLRWSLDKTIALTAMVLLLPLLAFIALRVKLEDGGKVFYTQERIGRRGRPFRIYKFRSMLAQAENDGPQLSHEMDPRMTRWGITLRRYRLDELPQLYNVLRGDMSLIGPRPERWHYIRQLLGDTPYLYLLHNVRPGITSWAMVNYGYASSVEEMQERLRWDWAYYRDMSPWIDLKTLARTILTVLKGKGK